MKNARKGFTIVELLMVIAVLAVLTGIITTAASAAIRQARTRRSDALRDVVQNGIATYYAQHGKWPPDGGKLQEWADKGMSTAERKEPWLTNNDYDKMMSFLVKECTKPGSSPVMDVSGLVVAQKTVANRSDGKARGQELRSAIEQRKKSGGKIKADEMAFGYTTEDGYFRRFKVTYNPESDMVSVSK